MRKYGDYGLLITAYLWDRLLGLSLYEQFYSNTNHMIHDNKKNRTDSGGNRKTFGTIKTNLLF